MAFLRGAEPGRGATGGVGKLTQARTATEIYRARLAELNYEARDGKLLVAVDVAASMRLCAESIVRDIELTNIAAPELVAAFRQGGEDGLRVALRKMTRRVLVTIAKNLRAGATANGLPNAPPTEDAERPKKFTVAQIARPAFIRGAPDRTEDGAGLASPKLLAKLNPAPSVHY